MVSKKAAIIVAFVIISSILGGTAIYINHYSKVKSFDILPLQNFNSSGVSNVSLPVEVSVQSNDVVMVGSTLLTMSGSAMEVNEYLLAYYNSSQNSIYYISIIAQEAKSNFSIPDSEPSQSILGEGITHAANYDAKSTFLLTNTSIIQFSPGNFKEYSNAGTAVMNITSYPHVDNLGNGFQDYVMVKYPVEPNIITPYSETSHNFSSGYYSASTEQIQQFVTYYFVSGIVASAHVGNNTIYWDTYTTFVSNQGLFTNAYNVYHFDYKFTVTIP